MTKGTYQLAEPFLCTACALKMEGTLKKISGVLPYDISFQNARFCVDFDEELVTTEIIMDRIRELGYEVALVKEEPSPNNPHCFTSGAPSLPGR